MISSITFSKDRACQLKLHLEFLKINGGNLFDINNNYKFVLYASSNDDFGKGYNKLKKEDDTRTGFRYDCGIFRERFLTLLDNDDFKYLCLFTDDDILYRKLNTNEEDIDRVFFAYPNLLTLSLRLGNNTIIQDPYNNTPTTFPTSSIQYLNINLWDWTQVSPSQNFGYPLSVDGHIFRRSDLVDIVKKADFYNPNSLESSWFKYIPKDKNLMACLQQSSIINTPINRVQNTCENTAGKFYGYSPEFLNEEFLKGKSLDFASIDFSNIKGCHQELEMKLI